MHDARYCERPNTARVIQLYLIHNTRNPVHITMYIHLFLQSINLLEIQYIYLYYNVYTPFPAEHQGPGTALPNLQLDVFVRQ